MQEARIALLQQMPIFGGIREDVLQFILELSSSVAVNAGEFFFREGDTAESIFVLEAGSVVVLKHWEGRQVSVRRLGRGDCFGEMALMDLGPRSASVVANEACQAIELSTASLFQIYERDLEQFAMIQMNMGREVSRRLREADERLFKAMVVAADVVGDYVIRSA